MYNIVDKNIAEQFAIRLIKGETLSREQIRNYIEPLKDILKEYKHNAHIVINQLKKA